MTGYIENLEANAESFFDGGWFRTGDVGFLGPPAQVSEQTLSSSAWKHPPSLAAGPWLTMTGRRKELINRGGEKVSPAEVEAVATMVEGVKEAVCFPLPDEVYGEQVALAVVSATGAAASRDFAYAVLAACRNTLASYQVSSTL